MVDLVLLAIKLMEIDKLELKPFKITHLTSLKSNGGIIMKNI